ncbi:MAG TPA: hypothetical protein VGB19_03180 [Actinomycetota bacterium]
MWVVIRPGIEERRHGELAGLIHEAFAGIEAEDVEIHVERARNSWESFTGRAYSGRPRRPRSHPETRYLVRLKVPGSLRNRAYPRTYRYPGLVTAPWITVADWRERFVALVAHEAFHTRQFREGLRRSEVQAERWAARTLETWRDQRPAVTRRRVRPPATAAAGHTRDLAAAAFRAEQLALFAFPEPR